MKAVVCALTVLLLASAPQVAIADADLACVGALEPAPGMISTEAPGLLERALGAPAAGGICMGLVYVVTEPVSIYRVWSSAAPNNRIGTWWALSPPVGTREEYRAQYAICPEWSNLDQAAKCTLRPGALVVVGPGQSALCTSGFYGVSAANQLFLPEAFLETHVEDCADETFPPTAPEVTLPSLDVRAPPQARNMT